MKATSVAEQPSPPLTSALLVFSISFAAVLLLHIGLLRLPYFWDEAGYYIPAARDFFLSGRLIPYSTPSNAHPPLVMIYLGGCWKLFGFSVVTTRIAMLAVSAFSTTGLFRLSEVVSNRTVAVATVTCSAVYPVFFVQSSLAQVDLAAAGLTFWALAAYAQRRYHTVAIWMSLAVMTKETAILAAAALIVLELLFRITIWCRGNTNSAAAPCPQLYAAMLCPFIVLCAWYAYHYRTTGYLLGNPEFYRYNVQATLSPLRFLIAFVLRLWQTFGYLHLWLLTAAMLLAMFRRPRSQDPPDRTRIPVRFQLSFLSIAVAYIIFMSAIGGAVLARYMLPIVPLVILTAVSTLWRRVRSWSLVIAIVTASFVAALFVPPPYGFSIEDNLAYRDYIVMHQTAARLLEAKFPNAQVLTAWPASDELTRSYLGYVDRPLRVVRIENFSAEQVVPAADARRSYNVVAAFSTKYEPTHPAFANWQGWRELKVRFFGFHRDLPPHVIAQLVGGTIEHIESRNGQWIAIIRIERIEEADGHHGSALMR